LINVEANPNVQNKVCKMMMMMMIIITNDDNNWYELWKKTALMKASSHGHIDIVRTLIDAGALIDLQNEVFFF
jgi:hypothetical protein